MNNPSIRYYISTYTSFSHNYVIALLSSNDAHYRFETPETEQGYSKFEVHSNQTTFNMLKEASQQNDGNAFTLEYGTY